VALSIVNIGCPKSYKADTSCPSKLLKTLKPPFPPATMY